jgi:hypothetical protein
MGSISDPEVYISKNKHRDMILNAYPVRFKMGVHPSAPYVRPSLVPSDVYV